MRRMLGRKVDPEEQAKEWRRSINHEASTGEDVLRVQLTRIAALIPVGYPSRRTRHPSQRTCTHGLHRCVAALLLLLPLLSHAGMIRRIEPTSTGER